MNWYIGQDIVCVKTYGSSKLKKDSVYTIKQIRETPCNCGGIDLDVGIKLNTQDSICIICGYSHFQADKAAFFDQICFRPLDELADISELTKVLKEPVFK